MIFWSKAPDNVNLVPRCIAHDEEFDHWWVFDEDNDQWYLGYMCPEDLDWTLDPVTSQGERDYGKDGRVHPRR